jgi:hypothetical protein
MKLVKLVPNISNCAILALLSLSFETWQSVQCFVSLVRTVCGTAVLNASAENPGAETGCCCV